MSFSLSSGVGEGVKTMYDKSILVHSSFLPYNPCTNAIQSARRCPNNCCMKTHAGSKLMQGINTELSTKTFFKMSLLIA